jgi:hypothetical protein
MSLLNPGLCDALERVADAILPLAPWIEDKEYVPSDPTLPWRQPGKTLVVRHMGIIAFLEGLLSEASVDAEIKTHLSSRAEQPLLLSPFDSVSEWRSLRGLRADPQFGVLESENVLTDVEGHPISRGEFYQLYLPLFEGAYKTADALARADKPSASAMPTLFEPEDIPDFHAFAQKILEEDNEDTLTCEPDTVTAYIWQQLGRIGNKDEHDTGQDRLREASGLAASSNQIRRFLKVLNKIIFEKLLYAPNRVVGLQLSQKVSESLATADKLKGWDLAEFNRLFLDDVFPGRFSYRKELDWRKFTERMWSDESSFWTRGLARKSSTFLRQWGRDVLYCVLGMRNPVDEPWKTAVLTELGEHRRVGNKFVLSDAEVVLQAFKDVFDPAMEAGAGSFMRLSPSSIPAIGSPPITSQQHQV